MDDSTDGQTTFQGKKVLITGGTTGIGRAVAAMLGRQGARVFICGRDPKALKDALEAIRNDDGEIEGGSFDLASIEGVTGFFSAADQWLGGLDIAVLNAGLGAQGELPSMTHEKCREVIDVNLGGYVSCALEAMNRMSGRGGQIVMTGSMSAEVREKGSAVYVATKAGIRGFAASLRKEANPKGIRVCLVEPGSTGTDMVDETPAEQEREEGKMEMLTAEDVARSIVFILQQPERCDIVTLQIRPRLQPI